MSLSAPGLSAGGGSIDSVDFDAIVAGGPAFSDRLQRFAEAAKLAGDTKQAATVLLRQAQEAQAAADRQLASNRADAAQLAIALEEAEVLKAALAAKVKRVDDIMRECPVL